MKEIILRSKNDREFLMKTFQVSWVTIWSALTFKTDSSLARSIRKLALEHGGILIPGECKIITFFDEESNEMVQEIGHRVKITVQRDTNKAKLLVDSDPKTIIENIKIDELMQLQETAQELASQLK